MEGIIQALLKAGIKATHFHTEHGRGMFEIPTGPLRPLDAVNALALKDAVHTIAQKHGFTATCFPKSGPGPSCVAVGTHTRFSIDNVIQNARR
jgi:glutamine synthetase